MRFSSSIFFAAAVVATLVTGCDWRKLDKAVERAPVLSVRAPGGYLGNDVGRTVVALPPPSDMPNISARYFVASTANVAAALVDLDAQGRPTVYNVSDAVLSPLNSELIGSIAVASRTDEPFPSVLLGVPRYKSGEFHNGALFKLKIQPNAGGKPGPVFVLDPAILPLPTLAAGKRQLQGYGIGVAAGAVKGIKGFDDWVVVGNAGVGLIENGAAGVPALITPSSTCELDFNPLRTGHLYENSRNPAIGDLIADLPGGEIAVGVPDAGGGKGGRVVILSRGATGVLECPIVLTLPGVDGFGSSVAIGYLNDDTSPDLIVGAPLGKVYVFYGPLITTAGGTTPVVAVPNLVISAPPGAESSDFGARVVLMEADGAPGPELMISAPGFPAGGVIGAGQIFAFKADGTPLPSLTISAHDPDENSNLGEGLAVLQFRNAGCGPGVTRSVLVGGANEEVFSYFQLPGFNLPGAFPDPRCFPAK
jgi:hypothetical protein